MVSFSCFYFNIKDGNIDIRQVSILYFESKINLNSTKLRYWLNYSQINSPVSPHPAWPERDLPPL